MIQTAKNNKQYSTLSIPKLLSSTNSYLMEQFLALPDPDMTFFFSFWGIETVMSLEFNRLRCQKHPNKVCHAAKQYISTPFRRSLIRNITIISINLFNLEKKLETVFHDNHKLLSKIPLKLERFFALERMVPFFGTF